MENNINHLKAYFLMSESKGKLFNVTFTKKDGSLRSMQARLGVTKHLKGGKLAYKPREHNLLTVFDMSKKAYRSISLDNVLSLNLGGNEYKVGGN